MVSCSAELHCTPLQWEPLKLLVFSFLGEKLSQKFQIDRCYFESLYEMDININPL